MTTAPLPSQAELAQLFRYDQETGKLFWKFRPVSLFKDGPVHQKAEHKAVRWNKKYPDKEVGGPNVRGGYISCSLHGRNANVHRLIWKLIHGDDPEVIDHVNGVVSDNRIANLRSVDRNENARNRKCDSRNISGCMGVHFDKRAKKWKATISVGGRPIHLGLFASVEDAAKARKAAEKEYGYHANHGR